MTLLPFLKVILPILGDIVGILRLILALKWFDTWSQSRTYILALLRLWNTAVAVNASGHALDAELMQQMQQLQELPLRNFSFFY